MSACVLQSHRHPLPHAWLEPCLNSVRGWAEAHNYEYLFQGDELFENLPSDIAARADLSCVIKSDLARLLAMQQLLQQFDAVVWLDADVLVVDQAAFALPSTMAVGREHWVQQNDKGAWRNYKKVHNAMMVFHRGDVFLPFYAETAQRFLRANQVAMPPQFIGPKLLTALHNVVQLPVWEQAGMMSPAVGLDILGQGDGQALALFQRSCLEPIGAINLCSSSCQRGELSDQQMFEIIGTLKERGRV